MNFSENLISKTYYFLSNNNLYLFTFNIKKNNLFKKINKINII